MKGLKKILTGILASAMALSMTLSVGTTAKADTTIPAMGKIKIENAGFNQTYDIYRVFDYIHTADDVTKGVYKLSSKFSGFTSTYFSVGNDGILDTSALSSEADAKAFGAEVIAYAEAQNPKIAADYTIEGDKKTDDEMEELAEQNADLFSVKEIDAEYGYYVMKSSLGSKVAVDLTNGTAELKEKTDVPSVDKKITGKMPKGQQMQTIDTTGNDAQIGDTLEFTVTADLKVGGTDYAIVDTMTDGLTLQKGGENYDITDFVISYTDKTAGVTASLVSADEHNFKIAFTTPTKDTKALVTYKALVNKNAVIATATNDNKVYLEYGRTHTPEHKTTTTTYPFTLLKFEGQDESKILAGAEFKVYRNTDKANAVRFTKSDDGKIYKATTETGDDTTDTIVTIAGSTIEVQGLDHVLYYVEETKAPQGYNRIVAPTAETLGGVSTKHYTTITPGLDSKGLPEVLKVSNTTGLELPSTGGIGTTIFYIIGGLLIVAAVVFFVVRRKADAE